MAIAHDNTTIRKCAIARVELTEEENPAFERCNLHDQISRYTSRRITARAALGDWEAATWLTVPRCH